MSAARNWPINTGIDGTPMTAGAASTRIQVAPAGDLIDLMSEDVMIDNPGPLDVFVRSGDATIVATARSLRVPAGSLQPYRKGQTTHIAAICPSGTQAIVIHVGDGA